MSNNLALVRVQCIYMNVGEFESLVEGAEESQSLDFKGPCSWDVKSLAKDILAFSNVQDGGHLIIGFDDKTFKRVGLSDEQAETFDQEKMQDQMAKFSDPFVTFSVSNNIIDSNCLRFVVIKVYEFSETPVICKADNADVCQGKMYYRSRRRRPESESVSNSYDLRDILDRATVKLMAKRQSQGYSTAAATDQESFYAKERGDL